MSETTDIKPKEETKPYVRPTPAPPPAPSMEGKMRVADGMCAIAVGWKVPVKDVTPAEALLLTAEHNRNVKGKPLELKEKGIVERTVSQELARLTSKYGRFKVAHLFPGAIPTLPKTYEEAATAGMGTAAPVNKLGSFAFGDKVG